MPAAAGLISPILIPSRMLKTMEIGLRNLIRPRLMPLALRHLQKEISGLKTMEEAINRAYASCFWDLQFRPMQVREEITDFLKKLGQKPLSTEDTIPFHYIVDGPESYVGGVPKFWRELKPTRPHFEIVKDWKQGGWGIGVLPAVKAI
jgi:hypothetical protein